MDLVPIEQGVTVHIPYGEALLLGRQPAFQLTSPKVSRQHCTLTCSTAYGGGPQVRIQAHKKLYISQYPAAKVNALEPDASEEVSGRMRAADRVRGLG